MNEEFLTFLLSENMESAIFIAYQKNMKEFLQTYAALKTWIESNLPGNIQVSPLTVGLNKQGKIVCSGHLYPFGNGYTSNTPGVWGKEFFIVETENPDEFLPLFKQKLKEKLAQQITESQKKVEETQQAFHAEQATLIALQQSLDKVN